MMSDFIGGIHQRYWEAILFYAFPERQFMEVTGAEISPTNIVVFKIEVMKKSPMTLEDVFRDWLEGRSLNVITIPK